MSETTTAETTATDATATTEQQAEQTKPTETVEFWKQKAREQEKRAKDNATAATELATIRDAQKTETEKVADRIAKAEAEVATVPAKVADALRGHLIALHEIDKDDAELFLTAAEPDLLLKQVARLVGRASDRKKAHVVPREGDTSQPQNDEMRAFARELFQKAD